MKIWTKVTCAWDEAAQRYVEIPEECEGFEHMGAVGLCSGGSSPAGNTTTTTVNQPWSGQQPYLSNVMSDAANWYYGNDPQYANPSNLNPGPTGSYSASTGAPQAQASASSSGAQNTAAPYQPTTTLPGELSLYSNGFNGGAGILPGTTPTPSSNAASNYNIPASALSPLNNNPVTGTGSVNPNSSYAPLYYPGQTYAGETTGQASGLASNIAAGAAGGSMSQIAGNAMSADNQLMNATNLANNPYIAAAAQGAIIPIYQNLMQTVLPQDNSAAIAQGAYGGARNGLENAQSINDANLAALDTTSSMYNSAYNSGLQAQAQGVAQSPYIAALQLAPGQAQLAAGTAQQALNQNIINDAITRYNYNQNLPLAKLQQYMQLIQGNYGGTSATSTPYFKNSAGSAIGGALGGAATGATLGSAIGPWGTAIGAIGGALAGALG